MSATCNGMPIVSLEVAMPAVGAWVAHVCVDAASLPQSVTITCGELTMVGTAVNRGTFAGRTNALVAGALGLVKTVSAKHYRQMSARTVLEEILGEAGELLDSTSEVSDILPSWLRIEGTASSQVVAVARRLGLAWRVRPTGEVWVGTPTWADAPLRTNTLLEWDRGTGRLVLGCLDPYLVPGMVYEGVKPANIIHRLDGRSVRTELYA